MKFKGAKAQFFTVLGIFLIGTISLQIITLYFYYINFQNILINPARISPITYTEALRRVKGDWHTSTFPVKIKFKPDGELGEYEALVLDTILKLTPEGEADTQGIDPGEEETLRRRVARLKGLIRGVAPDVILEPGIKWSIDLKEGKEGEQKVMYYPIREGPDRGLLYDEFRFSVALTIHEIGHNDISRITDPDFYRYDEGDERGKLESAAKWFLYNALDDPRVNEFEMRKHKGVKELFIGPLYDEHAFEGTEQGISFDQMGKSLMEQFGLGLIYRWAKGKNCPAITNPKVLEAIDKVWSDAEEIFKMIPERDNPTEEEKLEVARQLEERMQQKIWPVYKELLEDSLEQIKEGIQSGDIEPISEGVEEPGELSPEKLEDEAEKVLTEKVMKAAKDFEPKVDRPDLDEVKKNLPQDEDQEGHGDFPWGPGGQEGDQPGQEGDQPGGQGGQEGRGQEGEEQHGQNQQGGQGEGTGEDRGFSMEAALKVIEEFKRALPEYAQHLSRLNPLINRGVQHLRTVLEMEEDPVYLTGYPSGRPDIDAYIKWMYGRNGGKVDFFQRRFDPEERDYAFTLVIDESSSMADSEKTKNARDAAIFFMEILSRLGIDFSIIGFSNDYWHHEEFGKMPSMFDKERIIQEIKYKLSHGSVTNDAWAVEHAVEEMKRQPQKVKVILVISDGKGNLEYNSEILEEAERQGIKVIGIGIGAGMSYVEGVYTPAVLVDTLDKLPIAIRDILKSEILGR